MCDLVMFWIAEGKDPKDSFIARSKMELPPPGYTGSLVGTGWDQDVMLDEYNQAAGTPSRGPQN